MTLDSASILVVDDLPEQRLTIEAALAELGGRVVAVSSGGEALRYLLDHDVAVILLDVNMPDMDGFETAGLIRQRARNAATPIIFLTADHDEMQVSRGYALGAVDYITAPFLPDVLRTKVSVFVALDEAQKRVREEADRTIALQREQAARSAAEEQSRRMGLLGEVGAVLAGPLDSASIERGLLDRLVPAVADEAILRIVEAPHGDAVAWIQSRDSAAAPVFDAAASGPLAELGHAAQASGRVADAEQDAAGCPRRLALPLVLYGRVLGTLAVARDGERGFGPEDGELVRLIAERAAVAFDNRRLYRELQERDRRKDEFLAMLSHELRNPLGAITTAAHLLEIVGAEEEQAARARAIISRQSGYLSRMVDDLLEVSRVTMGRIKLERVTLDLRHVADATIEALRSSGRLDGHTVTVTGGGAHVDADAARMEQVITNLIVNAVKYTDRGGRITVEVDADDERARVRVTDDGIGIAPELLHHMFDLFVQGGQSLDRGQGGLGIGLTLVRRLVELQGGVVHAHSDGPNKGSTFVIELPRVPSPTPARESARPSRAPGAALRVLLVDDNADAREMLRALFELQRHEVHEAGSGPEALEAAGRVRPDLALVDLGLPGFDGLEVARRLRADDTMRDVVLVALTGYGQPEDRERSAAAGFEAHLVKPVMKDRLEEILSLVAARSSGLAL